MMGFYLLTLRDAFQLPLLPIGGFGQVVLEVILLGQSQLHFLEHGGSFSHTSSTVESLFCSLPRVGASYTSDGNYAFQDRRVSTSSVEA